MLCGQRNDDGSYVWHTMQRLPTASRIHRLHVDSMTLASTSVPVPNRMWIATDGSGGDGGPLYYLPIPQSDGNPLGDTSAFSANYCGSARIDMGAVDWGAPSTPKLYRCLDIWADNLASGAQWAKVYYTVDNEATRHLLGTSAKSPKDTLYFSSGEGSFVTGQSIALSLESFTASAAITPVYRSLVLRGALMPNSVDQITAQIRIADNVVDRQSQRMRSAEAMVADLRGFASSASPLKLVDIAGATSWVTVQRAMPEQEQYQAGNEEPEMVKTISMTVLDFGG